MDCDRVFMVLTKGPFPMGDVDDEALEDHLLSCESCRRFAMALQPTLDLFDEESSLDKTDSLPTYWGRLISADEQPSPERSSASLKTSVENKVPGGVRFGRDRSSRDRKASWHEPKSRWPLAVAFLVGIVFCLTSLEWLAHSSLWGEQPKAAASTKTGEAKRDVQTELASITPLANPTVCPRPEVELDHDEQAPQNKAVAPPPQDSHAAANQEKECCTKCHHADAASTLTAIQMAQVLLTCKECH